MIKTNNAEENIRLIQKDIRSALNKMHFNIKEECTIEADGLSCIYSFYKPNKSKVVCDLKCHRLTEKGDKEDREFSFAVFGTPNLIPWRHLFEIDSVLDDTLKCFFIALATVTRKVFAFHINGYPCKYIDYLGEKDLEVVNNGEDVVLMGENW